MCIGDAARPLAAALALVACQDNVGSVDVFLVKSPREDQNPLDPFVIARVRLRLTEPSHGVVTAEFDYSPAGSGSLPDVPTGSGWVLSVEALDASDVVRSRGRTLPFSIEEGTRQVELWIGRVGQSSLAYEPLAAGRAGHSISALPDGRLLVAGGAALLDRAMGPAETSMALQTAEILDPGSASVTDAGDVGCLPSRDTLCLGAGRAFHTATTLPSGEILLAGGAGDAGPLDSTELYAPDSRRLFAGPSMAVEHAQHVALDLPDGPLLAGGRGGDAAALREVELLREGAFIRLDPLGRARRGAAGALFDDGGLVTGGLDATGQAIEGPAEVFEPSAARFFETSSPRVARAFHAAVSLGDGRVLLLGGLTAAPCSPGPGCLRPATGSIEAYDPDTGTFAEVGSLLVARYGHTATALEDGTVLVVGGLGGGEAGDPVPQIEIVDPSSGAARMQYTLTDPRAFHTTTLGDNGLIYLTGGVDADGQALASVEVLVP